MLRATASGYAEIEGYEIDLKREGRPENVVQAVLHFIDNDFITGACLPVDGGRTVYAG
jgi:NAD(P)-dependent dehydrogenase (short-subunit alcohol dehydrogenase family)